MTGKILHEIPTANQYSWIRELVLRGGLKRDAIGSQLSQGLLDRMAERGWVEMIPGPVAAQDFYRVTPRGQALVDLVENNPPDSQIENMGT